MYNSAVCVAVLCLFSKAIFSIEHCPANKYLQTNDVTSGAYDNPDNVEGHVCTRKCIKGDNRVCYYRFVLERYSTMNGFCGKCPNKTSDCLARFCISADGYQRSVSCVNRQLPGPSIQVCQGDLIIVDVKNMLPGCSTAIHWHGIKQVDYQFMDGVPMVTQCPILEHQIFRYKFKANDFGTHFWHSHSGLQKVDGVVGSLIVRQPDEEDIHRALYDYDLPSHVIVVTDWSYEIADGLYPGIPNRGIVQEPKTYLINGRGRNTNGNTPYAVFTVKQGYRYRFRIVAGTCFECQYTLTIEKHDFLIIAADGKPIKPYRVNSLTMSPGERFSVIVTCNKTIGSYWMQVRTLGFCEASKAYQNAILVYKGHSGTPATPTPGYKITKATTPGITVNPFNSNCTKEDKEKLGPCISDLQSAEETPEHILGEPNHRIVVAFGFHQYNGNKPATNTTPYAKYIAPSSVFSVSSNVNGFTYEYPPSPLLSQWSDIPKTVFCPEYFPSDRWNKEHIQCTNVIKIPAKRVIEIVVCDSKPYGMSHPIHLHGYNMYMCEEGLLPQRGSFNQSLTALLDYLRSDRRKKLSKHLPMKDTVALTAKGYFVFRIYTDNPGYWYFHCHFAYHLESGMAVVLKVGKHEEMPKPPPGFPKCGDYIPKMDCDEVSSYGPKTQP